MKYFIYCRKSTESEDRQILSLDSQESEVVKLVATFPGVEVVESFRESQSAKKPGRPIFEHMLARIDNGEAAGIIAWNPDRLARNALDGARVIDLLDRGRLKDLKFSTFTFENSPQGKLMLFTLFGFSKYYVDSLSENIRRGNRSKAERGWRPSRPPIGYLHEPVTNTICPDPERFDLVRQMFRLMLSGVHTPRSVHRIAKQEWGLRTLRRKSQGGALLHLSSVNAILRNPFYAGVFKWDGRLVAGRHEPMITLEEFERVQRVFRRSSMGKPIRKAFPYTGILHCGSCGLSITAEDKRNRHGSRYTYYHCTRSRHETTCREKYVRKEALEAQLVAFLESLRLAPHSAQWLTEILEEQPTSRMKEREAQRASAEASIRAIDREIDALTDLRIRGILGDEEFMKRRLDTTRARLGLVEKRDALVENVDWIEPLRTLMSFSDKAVEYFRRGNDEQKRLILKTTSSNPTLSDRILSIEARKPFVQWGQNTTKSEMRRFTLDVRTLVERDDEDVRATLANARTILGTGGKAPRMVAPSSRSPRSPHVHRRRPFQDTIATDRLRH
ncbi:MAG TPA: recombinase family protein [Thermoanaerobaculia bacterium]|nr:recombinase family protein [Thermoanaerobaculia bacterium]